MVIATPLVEQLVALLAQQERLNRGECKDALRDLLSNLLTFLDRVAVSLRDGSDRPYDETPIDWIRRRLWEIQDHLRWLKRAAHVMSDEELAVQTQMTTREVRDLIALVEAMPERSGDDQTVGGAA